MFLIPVKAQVLTNDNAVINIDGAVVIGDTLKNTNGEVINDGAIRLKADYINDDIISGSGLYYIGGSWFNRGVFNAGFSDVRLVGEGIQNVVNYDYDDSFYKLTINNIGLYPAAYVNLIDSIKVAHELHLSNGFIFSGLNKLYLLNGDYSSLVYNDGRIIGRFERWLNSSNNYLFPLGSTASYNPMLLKMNANPTPGSVLASFIPGNPKLLWNTGLPLDDETGDTVEVHDVFEEAYWQVEANNNFAVSDYNIELGAEGFSDLQDITRVIKREVNPPGDWVVDGAHVDADTINPTVKRRNLSGGISDNGNHFAFGKVRPKFALQPENDTVCEGDDASFKVRIRGTRHIYYQWQFFDGSEWLPLQDTGVFYGTDTRELVISPAPLYLDSTYYRVKVWDKRHKNVNYSDIVILRVNRLPDVTISANDSLLCSDDTVSVTASSDLANSYFTYNIIEGANITRINLSDDQVTVVDRLINTGNNLDSVLYIVTPYDVHYGLNSIHCEGKVDTLIIYVNPNPQIDVQVDDTIYCNESDIEFSFSTLNQNIMGEWKYEISAVYDANLGGSVVLDTLTSPAILDHVVNDDTLALEVAYTFHPIIIPSDGDADCSYGNNDITITVIVNPTPRFEVSIADTVFCNEENVSFTITDLNGYVEGAKVYDLNTSFNAGSISGVDPVSDSHIPITTVTSDIIVNGSDVYQRVGYTFRYRFNDSRQPGDVPFCDHGIDTTLYVYIQPTARLELSSDSSITHEAIFCNGDSISFSVENIQTPLGIIRYDLEILGADMGNFSGYSSGLARDILGFTDTLSHAESTIQELYYRFAPYIEGPLTPTCTGDDDTMKISMVPVLSSNEMPDTFIGGNHISCFGLSDGVINLDAVGGDIRNNYQFQWRAEDDNGDPLQYSAYYKNDILDSLAVGIYYYSITDTLGCFFEDTIELTQPELLYVDSITVESINCVGDGSVGAIDLTTINGGIEAYSYEWRLQGYTIPFSTDRYAEGLFDGTYIATVIDQNGCTTEEIIEMEAAQPLGIFVRDSSQFGNYQVSCFGADDGKLSLEGTGGTEPYNFAWYDDAFNLIDTTYQINELTAGTYYLKIGDVNGCRLSSGDADTILVDNGDTLAMASFVLTEPDPISIAREASDLYPGDWDVPCHGDTLGKINIILQGGHTEYLDNTFTWSSPDGYGYVVADSIQDSLTVGTYNLHVEDFYSCFKDTVFILEEQPRISFDYARSEYTYPDVNISCFERTDGNITLANLAGGGAKGAPGSGEADFTYKWSILDSELAGFNLEDDTSKDLANIVAGTYGIRVTDILGCYIDSTIVLQQPDSLWADIDTSDFTGYPVSCSGFEDGWISVTPQGGTRGYSYAWSEMGASSDTIIEDIGSGYYSLTISDTNSCSRYYEWILLEPDPITLNPAEDDLVECYGDTSTLHLNPEGGVGSYVYSWGASELNGITAGKYYVEVRDANACLVTDSIELTQRSEILVEIMLAKDYNGRAISCFGESDASLTFEASGGNEAGPYTWEWSTGEREDTISGLADGLYDLTGHDVSGCEFTASFEVEEPMQIRLNSTTTQPLCNGDDSGEIRIQTTGGTPFTSGSAYQFFLNGNGATTNIFTGLMEGSYEIEVIDANECMESITLELVAPDALEMEYEITPAECPDESNGAVIVEILAGSGTPPYMVNEITSLQYAEFTGLRPGYFIVNVEDNNNCTKTDTLVIDTLLSSCLDIATVFTPNGDGVNDVWILDYDEDESSDMVLYPDAELTIYNRWGEIVFFTNNVAEEHWDGTFKGRPLPIDSYHYVLDLRNGDKPVTGIVTIIK